MSDSFFRRLVRRFTKYTVAGMSTFGLDLALLFLLTSYTNVPYMYLVLFTFLVATSINYYICYYVVFKGTERTKERGYVYFILFATVAAILISLGTSYLVQTFALSLFLARIIVGTVAGLINFLFNAFFNFRLI